MEQTGIIPPPRSGRPSKYDFGRLTTYGDSIFIDTKKPKIVSTAAHQYAERYGFKVATRIVTGGIRIYHAGERG